MKLLHNAHFYLNSGFDNPVTALLIDQGRIASLLEGTEDMIKDAERIDLHGAWVYPGFIDAHTHSFSGGLYQNGVDLSGCTCLDEVFTLLAEANRTTRDRIFAWRFAEENIREKRFPTLLELDRVCPRNQLLLRRIDGHSCVLNSYARRVVPGLQSAEEVLTGVDNDLAVNWLQENCTARTILNAYQAAAQAALKGGFTRLHTMIGDAQQDNQHYRLVRQYSYKFPISFELYPQSFNISDALDLEASRIGGCILADGSLGSHTAALSSPYQDNPGTGNLYQSDSFWNEFIASAHANRLQVGVHCIGDAAISQINNAYLRLDPQEVRTLRHQLIHCELTPDPLLERIAASGATPVMQPNFDLLWGGDSGFYAQRLGVERSRQMNRWASFTRAGVRVCGSSDWYITELNIAMSLHAAINHHNPDERLSPAEAIRVYTENNAWLAHAEDRYGRISPGFEADLSVMDTDFTKPFDYTQVRATAIFHAGEQVYAST